MYYITYYRSINRFFTQRTRPIQTRADCIWMVPGTVDPMEN